MRLHIETSSSRTLLVLLSKESLAQSSESFEIAREDWNYTDLDNPLRVKITDSGSIRNRPVSPEELRALLKSARNGCFGLNRLYVPLMIYLIAKTGLREAELCSLKWEALSISAGRLMVVQRHKTKKKKKLKTFTTVIPIDAWIVLKKCKHPDDKPTDWVFVLSSPQELMKSLR